MAPKMKLSTSSMFTGLLMFEAPANVPDVNGFAVAFAGLVCGCAELPGEIEKA